MRDREGESSMSNHQEGSCTHAYQLSSLSCRTQRRELLTEHRTYSNAFYYREDGPSNTLVLSHIELYRSKKQTQTAP